MVECAETRVVTNQVANSESKDLIHVKNLMIAANANTVFNAVSYQSGSKLIAYAASNTVLILNPFSKDERDGKCIAAPKVIASLNKHTTRVNAV